MSSSIKYLKHDQIDKTRWDWNIKNSVNGNLYGWSWYLDAVSPNWEALILGDYQSIMPLTWRRKYGLFYLYRPLLSQQQGVYSIDLPSASLVANFMDRIPKKFRILEFSTNKFNSLEESNMKFSSHQSCELDLIGEYDSIYTNFSKNTKRNLKKAQASGIQLDLNLAAEPFLQLLVQDPSKGSQLLSKPANLAALLVLLQKMKSNNAGRILGAKNKEGELISAVLFGKSHHKWYYLAPVNTDQGRQQSALFLLINTLISENSGQAQSIDFEGSDLPGVARFYEGFGAQFYFYSMLRENRLPWPLKHLKG